MFHYPAHFHSRCGGPELSFWESLSSVGAASILLPPSASSEFGPLSFIIKYCEPMS